ncbi:heterokaryon incompatibility protein-domain-containing protein [Xylaria digitata]|nr:heterokaryon incompatibility protein-domain-containing protein [Xylaria digitata]
MAGRYEEHARRDHNHYQHYHDRGIDEERHELKVNHRSDNERERRVRHSRRQAPSPPRVSHPSRASLPPLIHRTQSTYPDQNPSGQQRPEILASTLNYPPVPTIVVSEDSKPLGHPPQHTGRSLTDTTPARNHIQWSAPPSSSLSGTLGSNVYQYEELQPPQFRLVRVLHTKMSAIKCDIIHESLANPPPYICISYAWGDADDKRPIQIDNANIYISVNVFEAIDAVRRRRGEVLVWIDALCIDQQNRDERSQQVQLMAEIYEKAEEVAIWLGQHEDDSELAEEFLKDIAIARDPEKIRSLLSAPARLRAIGAVVCLFQRDYWKRLWVVQEVFNAKTDAIKVYCGGSPGLPWGIYKRAARAFERHKRDLDSYFPVGLLPRDRRQSALLTPLSYSQALVYEGPNSFYDFGSLDEFGEESLLYIMRTYRRKLTSEPRDRIFGILGILPNVVRKGFPVDYNMSVKDIYTNVVDFLLYTTERLDVICESIHYPKQTSVNKLPSWVPDWSQNPETTALGYAYDFAAAGHTRAEYRLLDQRRNELQISAIRVDAVGIQGVAVGTLCTLGDYLMAFLNWHAILIESTNSENADLRKNMEEAFCRTLCLGKIPLNTEDESRPYSPSEWKRICYQIFAAQMRSRLPQIPLNDKLRKYADIDLEGIFNPRQFLQSNFGSRMMGRCFFLTAGDRMGMGMGTGLMLPDDIIIIPLGCRTPIVVRKEGNKRGRYRFVGDIYLDGYMNGKVIAQLERREREVEKFVLI